MYNTYNSYLQKKVSSSEIAVPTLRWFSSLRNLEMRIRSKMKEDLPFSLGRVIILFTFLFIIYPESNLLFASETSLPFSKIALRFNGAHNSNQNIFHEFWEPEFGAEFIVEMPFYLAEIQGGIHLYPYSGRSEYQPDFLSVFIFIGWGADIDLYRKLSWYNGIQIGSYQMSFDDSDIHESQALESELGVGFNTRFEFRWSKSWSVQTGAAYMYIYTKKPIELFMITAGLSYTFDTPIWLTEFLK